MCPLTNQSSLCGATGVPAGPACELVSGEIGKNWRSKKKAKRSPVMNLWNKFYYWDGWKIEKFGNQISKNKERVKNKKSKK